MPHPSVTTEGLPARQAAFVETAEAALRALEEYAFDVIETFPMLELQRDARRVQLEEAIDSYELRYCTLLWQVRTLQSDLDDLVSRPSVHRQASVKPSGRRLRAVGDVNGPE